MKYNFGGGMMGIVVDPYDNILVSDFKPESSPGAGDGCFTFGYRKATPEEYKKAKIADYLEKRDKLKKELEQVEAYLKSQGL